MAQQTKPKVCDVREAGGKVTVLDWVGSLLVVGTGIDELSLVVSKETVFRNSQRKLIFSEINLNDVVVVKYYDCGFAGLKAISVTVTS
jgi:hypothetical protein